MFDQHKNHYTCHHRRRQGLMRQSKTEDERVSGDEYDTCDKQYPGAGKHTTVFFHDLHPLAAMAEITCNTEPPRGQTASPQFPPRHSPRFSVRFH